MARKLPRNVETIEVYRGRDGFRYTCRDGERKIVYDSQRFFSTQRRAAAEARTYWPTAKVSFG